ncbi:hypothetical protein [Streptomyces alkaliterrae]|uniref:Uncharacterized protein n=1 Tax=Streptomyces alkaliterrae TaxID=2213162 RepID=A0A7W3WVG3_9ACTN|nr:hypothetical protein [Streptomyces alkaliterrae]MBB1252796.1 hypothetical protein [Streptomyces alkaliterrae]MBB1259040.1 hypothetical protein [Streptomyces alkaliterrae]
MKSNLSRFIGAVALTALAVLTTAVTVASGDDRAGDQAMSASSFEDSQWG